MNSATEAAQKWLFDSLAGHAATVFEAMAGERPAMSWEAGGTPEPESGPDSLNWRQGFRGAPGAAWLTAATAAWTAAGKLILTAAGMEDSDQDTLKSTYLETLGQAMSGLAQDLSAKLGHEVTCESGEEVSALDPRIHWGRLRLKFSKGEDVVFLMGIDPDLLGASVTESDAPADIQTLPPPQAPPNTFDLLLDVELPVSVSFGRAQLPLKDLLKLTTGSVVELNRFVAEPVEVIVNNCVIARGEVVVVQGNFGVRVQQVISRQERLRTLD